MDNLNLELLQLFFIDIFNAFQVSIYITNGTPDKNVPTETVVGGFKRNKEETTNSIDKILAPSSIIKKAKKNRKKSYKK